MNWMEDNITDTVFEILNTTISVPMILFNAEETIYFNKVCGDLFGFDSADYNDFIGKEYTLDRTLLNSDLFERVQEGLKDSFGTVSKEIVMKKKNGQEIVVEYNGKILCYKGKECIMAQLYDITEKKNIEKNLLHLSKVRALMLEISQSVVEVEDINAIYDLILKNALNSIENSDLGSIFILDGDVFRIVAYNGFSDDIEQFVLPVQDSTLYKMTGGKMDEIKYMEDINACDRYYPVTTNFDGERLIKSTITTPIFVDGKLFGMINIDSLQFNKFTDDDIKTMQFIQNSVEIAISNHLLYEKARYLSKYDCLTSLYNRTYFNEAFAKLANDHKDDNGGYYVVIIDLNGLKQINDVYGHHVGDSAIQAVANAIKKTVRVKDFIARIGGDEFCGVYFHTTKEDILKRMEAAMQLLRENPLHVGEHEITLSYSFGVSKFPEEGFDFGELGKLADKRMYRYKKEYKENLKKKEENVSQ